MFIRIINVLPSHSSHAGMRHFRLEFQVLAGSWIHVQFRAIHYAHMTMYHCHVVTWVCAFCDIDLFHAATCFDSRPLQNSQSCWTLLPHSQLPELSCQLASTRELCIKFAIVTPLQTSFLQVLCNPSCNQLSSYLRIAPNHLHTNSAKVPTKVLFVLVSEAFEVIRDTRSCLRRSSSYPIVANRAESGSL